MREQPCSRSRQNQQSHHQHQPHRLQARHRDNHNQPKQCKVSARHGKPHDARIIGVKTRGAQALKQHQADQHGKGGNAAGPKRIFRAHCRRLPQNEFAKSRLRRLRHGLHEGKQRNTQRIEAGKHNGDGSIFTDAPPAGECLHRKHTKHARHQRPSQQGRQGARISAKCGRNHGRQHHARQSSMAHRISHQRAPAQQRESANRATSKPKQGTTRQHH